LDNDGTSKCIILFRIPLLKVVDFKEQTIHKTDSLQASVHESPEERVIRYMNNYYTYYMRYSLLRQYIDMRFHKETGECFNWKDFF
jgi:hypothetical protein